jgi:hypothetical protein
MESVVKMRPTILVLCVLLLFTAALLGADESGYIKARGKPTGAGLFLDGKYVGPAGRFTVPEKYAVAAGDHEITLRDPRYEDFTTKVTVRPRKTTKISYKMKYVEPAKPPFGRLHLGGDGEESFLSLAAGDTGAVYINDRYFGFVDELNNAGGGILLNPGTYNVRIVSAKYGDISRQVTIEANKVTVIPLEKK